MNMKEHILAALQEQFERWEALLASLDEGQIDRPQFDQGWSIKDVMAHLWAWQQVSIARMEAGARHREPYYPLWIVNNVDNWEENADQVNAVTYKTQHNKPWSEVYQNWEHGFLQFIELGNQVSERDLLDGDRYAWLNGYSLAAILIASYEHHEEHFEKLTNWLQAQK
jgi:hypothetical protein